MGQECRQGSADHRALGLLHEVLDGGPLVVLSWWTSCFGGSKVSATSTGSLSSAKPWSLHGVFTCHTVAPGDGGKAAGLGRTELGHQLSVTSAIFDWSKSSEGLL